MPLTDVLVAGYAAIGPASEDFDRLVGLVVDRAYGDRAPYAVTGTVKQVVFDLEPAGHEDEKALHEAAQHANLAHGAAA